MKNDSALTIRYTGSDFARRFVIQRGDGKFWNGGGWSATIDKAVVFATHKSAQVACVALQYEQYRGKPVRTFKIEVNLTLVADDVQNISQEDLMRYIAQALRLDVENAVYGDGPTEDSYLQARMILKTLRETKTRRKKF